MDAATFRAAIQEARDYLRSLKGQRIVVHLPGDLEGSDTRLDHLADLVLLHQLGMRLVVVFAPPLPAPGDSMDAEQLSKWTRAVADTQQNLIGSLNRALPGTRPRSVVFNAVAARPLGVHNGRHSGFLGDIRSLDIEALAGLLDGDHIVLVPPLAAALLGDYYALDSKRLAARLAASLPARKLVVLGAGLDSLCALGSTSEGTDPLSAADLRRMAENNGLSPETRGILNAAALASEEGVERVHLLDMSRIGVLIAELYTRKGAGALVARSRLERVRPARAEDAAGLLQLIEPMERKGILIQRSRAQLEREIDNFLVLELEGHLIGCCAMVQHGPDIELAALTIEAEYRNKGRASHLLEQVEKRARQKGARRLLVFTTVAEDWFAEHGFEQGAVKDLPEERAALYNYSRNSVILIKSLTAAKGAK